MSMKSTAQRGAIGSRVTTWGYTMNARPAPRDIKQSKYTRKLRHHLLVYYERDLFFFRAYQLKHMYSFIILRSSVRQGEERVLTVEDQEFPVRGCLPQCILGYTPPPGRHSPGQTPPRAATPRADTPPGSHPPGRHPPGRHYPGQTPPWWSPKFRTNRQLNPLFHIFIFSEQGLQHGGIMIGCCQILYFLLITSC